MAKIAITEVSANNTFQVWLDKTNELVNLVQNDIVTASLASANGDITIGNATLDGDFRANTITALDLLRVDTISPEVGSTAIEFTAPINITTNQTVLERLSSTTGPRLSFYNTIDSDWQVGFENNTTKKFIISNGGGTLKLDTSGNLEITGTFSGTAQTANTVTLVATNSTSATHYLAFVDNPTGNENVRTDTDLTYNPGTGTLTATTFVGNVSGTISGNAATVTNGVYTVGNQTIAGIKTFTSNIVGNITGNAATVTNGVYTTGDQTIGGNKTFSSNIKTSSIIGGGYLDQDTTEAAFFGTVTQSASSYAPLIKIRSTGTGNVTTGSFGILHNTDNTQEVTIHLIQANDTNSRIWRFSQAGDFTSPGDVTAFSDERLKTNICTIDSALDKVVALRGVSFVKDGRSSIGVIAQEVEKVIPEVVHDGEYKSVAYGNLVGLLIEAIKELKSELDEIKGR
jgi:hypothetical protein